MSFIQRMHDLLKKKYKEKKIIEDKIKKILIKKTIIQNSNQFSWYYHSWAVIRLCPQYIIEEELNWENTSQTVAEITPEFVKSDYFNWKDASWAVVHHCPENLDLNKANLQNIIEHSTQYKNMSLKEIKHRAIINKI